jgi:competence protein ComFC
MWLARQLGREIMGPSLELFNNHNIILIPMPISKKRLRKRGYNQSEQLAKGCLSSLKNSGTNSTIVHLLEKIQDKKSQVEMSPFERWTNPRGSLRVSPKTKQRIPRDALLVLIDDTVTTGSTLIYAAEVIREEFPEQPLHLLALALEV